MRRWAPVWIIAALTVVSFGAGYVAAERLLPDPEAPASAQEHGFVANAPGPARSEVPPPGDASDAQAQAPSEAAPPFEASEVAPEAEDAQAENVPQDHPDLDAWLLEHPAKDPRIVVTIVDSPRAEATVHLYDGEKLVATFYGFGGPPDNRTIEGEYRIIRRLGTVHTGLYRETEGHEYYLRNFLQIQGNYGFHAYKINDATDEEEPGPTHGCVNLPAGDMEALYHWVKIGTPVEIRYVNADTAGTS